jgi:hypothetical protein
VGPAHYRHRIWSDDTAKIGLIDLDELLVIAEESVIPQRFTIEAHKRFYLSTLEATVPPYQEFDVVLAQQSGHKISILQQHSSSQCNVQF